MSKPFSALKRAPFSGVDPALGLIPWKSYNCYSSAGQSWQPQAGSGVARPGTLSFLAINPLSPTRPLTAYLWKTWGMAGQVIKQPARGGIPNTPAGRWQPSPPSPCRMACPLRCHGGVTIGLLSSVPKASILARSPRAITPWWASISDLFQTREYDRKAPISKPL